MKKEDEIDLDLLFDDEGWSTLVIEGNDKDRVFILFSDLREYIQNEVCTIRSPKKISANFIQMILIMGLLIAVIFSVSDFLGNQQTITMNIDEAIASQDVIEKLNYLLSAYSINSIKFFDDPGVFAIPITFVFVIFLLFFDVPILKFVRYFFPSHLFLFGKEIERNVRRKQLLNNILWVVIIGGIISAITGLVLK